MIATLRFGKRLRLYQANRKEKKYGKTGTPEKALFCLALMTLDVDRVFLISKEKAPIMKKEFVTLKMWFDVAAFVIDFRERYK